MKHGRYVLFEEACILIFDTRSKKGRMIHNQSEWARKLFIPEDKEVIRNILENGELTVEVHGKMALTGTA